MNYLFLPAIFKYQMILYHEISSVLPAEKKFLITISAIIHKISLHSEKKV